MKSKTTPLRAIRKECLLCANNQAKEVQLCPVETCPLYFYRFGRKKDKLPPTKAIRRKCFDCGEGTYKDIKECEHADCALFYYRFGKNPRKKGNPGSIQHLLKKVRVEKGRLPRQEMA